jgi:hypothetical protein
LDGHLARRAGRLSEALALYREAVRASVLTHDWVLEMMARENLADLLWETGAIEDAAREACALLDELREKPLTPMDMFDPFTMAMSILSEMGRTDEASAVAGEALPLMQRARGRYVGGWAHLFWRRDQINASLQLLGAWEARCARAGAAPQPNEQRLIAEVRTALLSQRDSGAFASSLAAGAALDDTEIGALIAECLHERP